MSQYLLLKPHTHMHLSDFSLAFPKYLTFDLCRNTEMAPIFKTSFYAQDELHFK